MARLDVYVAENCFGCAEARRLAAVVASRFGRLSVRVVDLEREPDARPDSVVAVPSYVLDGRVIALGNPRQTELFLDLARLLATPSIAED
jgi:hypothetical protein